MPEGYLSSEKTPPQAQPEQQPSAPNPSAPNQRNIESMLTINAMKVMYSDEVWPDIQGMLGQGVEGVIKALVHVAVNILDLAKHKGYQPSDDELLTAGEEMAEELVDAALAMGSVEGDQESLIAQVLGQAIAQIAQKRPEFVNMENLKQLAATATIEEQAEAEAMFGNQQQTPPQQQQQPQQGGGYLNGV